MRLIDADAFKEHWNKEYRMRFPNDKYLVALSNFPTIDPESLRPKGEWVVENEHSIRCSECCFNRASIKIPMDFCPYCGADMRARESRDV